MDKIKFSIIRELHIPIGKIPTDTKLFSSCIPLGVVSNIDDKIREQV